MGKAKRHKKALADAVYTKKTPQVNQESSNPFASAKPATSKKLNPFEVHVNKEKFQILGRICKHDKGLPGVSREKAVKKRKETLGVQYQIKHKTNRFRDRRIGKFENSDDLPEDVLNARFAAERMERGKYGKLSKFDLNDDEVLTHRGQTLEDIEQFRDDRSDDGDDEIHAELDANFTEVAHFGGDDETEGKDRQAAIDEMILEQKKRKLEIAKEKDEVHDLTEKLDTNYRTLMGVMSKLTKSDEDRGKPEQDDYDKAMREMIFERRGVVTDKLLSQEELAKREKDRLEKLESERLQRMRAEGEDDEEKKQINHRSADALDDGYYELEAVVDDNVLAYNEKGEISDTFYGNNETNGIEDDEDNGNDGSNNESEEDDSEEEEEDDLSDLRSEKSNDEEETNTKSIEKKSDSRKKVKSKNVDKIEDLPFTFDMPGNYEEFKELLEPYTVEQQAVIVERLIKCNNPKLDGVNRENVVKLFAFLLQYLNELFAEATEPNIRKHFEILGKLNPFLFDLMHLNAEKVPSTLLDVIEEKYSEFCSNPKKYPSLETVIFFKLVSNFCSTSDFRHPIATPTVIFMQHILSRAKVHTRKDLAIGLFIVTIMLEFTEQSHRFLPAAVNFMAGIIYLCTPKRPIEVLRCVPPFEVKGTFANLLVLSSSEKEQLKQEKEESTGKPLKSEDFVSTDITIDFKLRSLNTTLLLIKDSMQIVGENVGSNYLAQFLLDMLDRLPSEVYPSYIGSNYAETRQALETVANKKLIKLVPPEKKPQSLKFLEPRFERIYDDKRRPKLTKEKEERVKLIHKLRRETKGAVREIRRDNQFIQKMKLQQQIRSDKERQAKVKRIFHEASVQQGELNEFARIKKKKKF